MCLHRREPMTSLQIQMDQSGDWKLQQQGGGEKFDQKPQFLPKRILQFVFSVSVFSLLLWYSYGCSILPYDESINAFFSTFLLSISSHILKRKYMFLLCNAILAFLAKTSLSISDTDDGNADGDDGSLQSANVIPASMEEAPLMAQQEETDIKEQVSSEEADGHEEQEENAENTEVSSIAKEDEQVGTVRDNTDVMAVKKKDGDDEADENMVVAEENEELSNADELNRKFEEFIRKMKEEIRIEAQRQLVAAV